jgi:hypothetical protein
MSLRGIVAITNKVKLRAAEREKGRLYKNDDIESKSKTTKAIELFCDGKSLT